MDKRLPACKDLERSARDFLASQRAKMNSETNDVLATAAATRILAFIFFGLTVVCSLVIEQLGRMDRK